jgi:hypothetical protein
MCKGRWRRTRYKRRLIDTPPWSQPMRALPAVPVLLLGLAGPAFADCKGDVEAAFAKQQQQPAYRIVSEMPGEAGKTTVTIDYVRPDKMHQTVVAPGQPAPLETIAIARWAWANQGGGFEELQPQFAQAVTASVRQALSEPVQSAVNFACLGEVAFEGGKYLGYRGSETNGEAPPDRGVAANPGAKAALERIIYVDTGSGLPAFNIIVSAGQDSEPVVRNAFSYGGNIVVEAPVGAAPAPLPR